MWQGTHNTTKRAFSIKHTNLVNTLARLSLEEECACQCGCEVNEHSMNTTRRSVERGWYFSLVSGLRWTLRLSQISVCNATHLSSSVQLRGRGADQHSHKDGLGFHEREECCATFGGRFTYEMERQEPFSQRLWHLWCVCLCYVQCVVVQSKQPQPTTA